MNVLNTLFLVIMIGLVTQPLESRPQRVNQIPNGNKFQCASCHISAGGGGARTLFGETVNDNLSNGNVRWDLIFNIDSDGDGFANGEELQDPDGQWSIGQANPGDPSLVTQPWNPNSKPTTSSVEDDFVSRNSNVYPVPSLGVLNVNYLSNYFEKSKLELFDLDGNIVYSDLIESELGENKLKLDFSRSSMNSGNYFLVIRNKYYTLRKRIIFIK